MLMKRTVYTAYLIALCLNSVNAIYEPTNHLASRNKNPSQNGNVKTFSWQHPSNNDPVDVEIHHNYSKVSHHSTVNPNYSPGNGMFPILTTTPVPLARKPRNYYHEAAPQQIKRERYQQLLVAPRDTCPPGHTGRLPVTESCNMFLNCYKGRGYTQPCAAGTLFNAHTLECDHAYKVACIADEMKRHARRMSADNRDMRTLDRSMQQECVKGFVGVMPNYWDCTKYIMCQDNSRKLMMDCDRGMLFDIRTNRCRFQREAYCFNVGDLQDSKTQFPSQTNNGGYEQQPIQNQNGVQYGGYQQGNCPPSNVGGLLPHPVHCQMYLQCNHGQLIERPCGIGTVFNPSLGVCDHPGKVNCHKSNQQNEQTDDGGYRDSRFHGGYTNQFKGNARDTYGNSHQNQPNTPFNRSSVEYNTKTHQFDSEYHDNFGANLRPTTSDFSDYQNGGQNTNLNYLTTTTTTPPPIDLDEGGGYGYYLVRPARMPPQPPGRGSSLGTPQWPPPFPDVVNTDYDYVIDYEELPLDATWLTKHTVSTTTARPSGVRYNNRPNDGRVCREGLTFECQANDCIDISLVCDTNKDCGNGKDEFNCAESIAQFTQTKSAKLAIKEYTKYRNITKTYCAKLCYEALDFVCKSFNYRQIDDSCFLLKANVAETGLLIQMPTYIYYEHITHTMDCTDLYMCKNNKCIDRSQVCDGVDDCLDRQDERNCAADVLGYTLNLETPHGFRTNEGNLVVTAFGRSGYICDDGFLLTSAHVACKELGYGAGALQVHPRTYYPIRSQSFGYGYANTNGSDAFYMMDDVMCAGDETQLKDCYFAGWGVNDCEGNEVLGVVCQNNDDSTKTTAKNNAGHKQEEANETAHYVCTSNEWLCQAQAECLPLQYLCDGIYDCADRSDEWERLCTSPLEIRLSNNPDAGKGTNQKMMAGRLEVRRHGTWGTVCDDRFKDGEATVACRQIFGGRIGGVVGKVLRDAPYGPGLGPIWLDQVTCAGNESNLTDCAYAPWNRHNCDHNEDVAIQCTLQQSPTRPTNVNRKYPQHYGGVKTLSSGGFRRFTKEDLELYNYPGKCGVKADDLLKSGATFRVLNAPSAPPGSVPWQATISLRSHNVLRPVHWCGGVILSPLHVLTAAHCLDGVTKSNIRISAGDYDRDIDEGTEQIARIEDFIQHEEFRHGSRKNNDIAVIKLSEPGFNMTDDVKAICLPERDAEYRDGADCEVSGFGVTQHSVRKASRQLKAASIPIQTRAVCKMPHIYGNELMEGMFCAGSLEGGIDACDGDSGGPLACIHEGYYTLFGITSWGHKCGEANKPGVYVKVAYYRGWIQDAIAKLNLD